MSFLNFVMEGDNLILTNALSNDIVEDNLAWGQLTLDCMALSYHSISILFKYIHREVNMVAHGLDGEFVWIEEPQLLLKHSLQLIMNNKGLL